MKKNFTLFLLLTMLLSGNIFAQDSTKVTHRAVQASLVYTATGKTKYFQAYTFECMKIKTPRKYVSWELGGNYMQSIVDFPIDTIPTKIGLANTTISA